jgi:FKBP-type peptidyl-prolyl cis-trans isomerase
VRSLRAIALLGVLMATACGYADPNPNNGPVAVVATTTATPVPGADDFNNGAKLPQVKLPDGLQYADVKAGTGQVVKKNDLISVHYTGWLTNGTKFDSSRDRGEPFDGLQIGAGQVIPGWDEGVVGMKVGGLRRLVIPSALGYGDSGSPQGCGGDSGQPCTIPGGATLVFLVEVLSDKGPAPPSPSPSPSPT